MHFMERHTTAKTAIPHMTKKMDTTVIKHARSRNTKMMLVYYVKVSTIHPIRLTLFIAPTVIATVTMLYA